MDRRKVHLRVFLLAPMNHFLANEWKRGQTRKRGGAMRFLFLDAATAEEGDSSLTDFRPKRFQVGVGERQLFDGIVAAGFDGEFEPFPGLVQLPHLTRVAR